MTNLTLILLAAGSSSRFELTVKKQWIRIESDPLWQFVANSLQNTYKFKEIIIVSSKDEIEYMKIYADFRFVEGGTTRQQSLKNALKYVDTEYVLVSDIARACIETNFLKSLITHHTTKDCIVPYLGVNDTIVYDGNTIDRDKIKRIQTPQLSKTAVLRDALNTNEEFTDESSAIVANGGTREFVKGDINAIKITYLDDLKKIPCLKPPSTEILSGTGFDAHGFEDAKELYLCGVKIDSDYGFKAHSDGDVAIHALIDALLGASGLGDIGMMFPDNDDSYKGIDSKILLHEVVKKIFAFGFVIVNVDLTIIAQKPRLSDYKLQMRKTLAKILKCNSSRVNIKATTTENLGFIGRKEGVGVIANANLKYFDWRN